MPIRRRGTGWEIYYDLGIDPTTGRRRRRFQAVKGNKADAKKALTAALSERDVGLEISPDKLTTVDYLRRWLRDYAAHNVAQSTLTRYTQIVERHLIPRIGALHLRDLRPAHIAAAYAASLAPGGRADKRIGGLSTRTVEQHHAVLREALKHAVKLQLLPRNPCDAVEAPRPSRKEMRVLSREESHKLLQAAEGTRHFALIYTALATGARQGELLAARWADIDWDTASVRIVRTARREGGKGIQFHSPKTHRSRRAIDLSPDTIQVLKSHRHWQIEQKLATGAAYVDIDLVFANDFGKPLDGPMITRDLQKIATNAGLEPIKFHTLRHSACSLMLAAGVGVKIVSERMGHVSSAFTLDTYAHALPGLQKEAAVEMDKILRAAAQD